jgi:hypothetical protein
MCRSDALAIQRRYVSYPPNASSPPSPVSTTDTDWRAKRDTRYVGIAELSPNGSPY